MQLCVKRLCAGACGFRECTNSQLKRSLLFCRATTGSPDVMPSVRKDPSQGRLELLAVPRRRDSRRS